MLLTRCPACTTAFRITADLLKQASGQVRCGRCNHVFPAFAHLEEAETEPDAHGIGSYAPSAESAAQPAPGLADELAETSEFEALPRQISIGAGITRPADAEQPAQPVTADELVEIFDADPAKAGESSGGATLARENKVLLATIDPDQPLDFELPPDEWQAFYEAEGLVEQADQPPKVENVLQEAGDEAPANADQTAPADQASPDIAFDETATRPDADSLEIDAAAAPSEAALAEAQPEQPARQAPSPHGAMAEDEQGQATDLEHPYESPLPKPADPVASDLLADELPADEPWALTTHAGPLSRLQLPEHWWRIGAAVLAVVLVLQLTHHFRNDLATLAGVGRVMRALYGGLDANLAPDWDVQQYEIDDWVATAAPDPQGQNSLLISATLVNRGPREQPHPYVRLELKDRWDESVGSRIFKPAEYLARAPDPGELMASGAKVPALLAVVDPGNDAYGFELDVCVPSGAEQLRCANQNVF